MRRPFGRYGNGNTAIRREYFEPRLRANLNYFFIEFERSHHRRNIYGLPVEIDDLGVIVAVIDEAINRKEPLNERPVTLLQYIPAGLYENVLEEFLQGFITAQQAADEMHNRIALWLIE